MRCFLRRSAYIVFFIAAASFSNFAQDAEPGIIWTQISEEYSQFVDVIPTIENATGRAIYYDVYDNPSASIVLERLGEDDEWLQSLTWACATGYKPVLKKVGPGRLMVPNLHDEFWYRSTVDDYVERKFTQDPDYTGRGKYRLKFIYGFDKKEFNSFVSYSPVFEVNERRQID